MLYRLSTAGRRALLPAMMLATAIAVAGCGGGGNSDNGDNISDNTILGKIVDTNGFGVPGANVNAFVTGSTPLGGSQANTITDGGYRIGSLFPGVYTVTANTSLNGVNYTGSTQAVVTAHSIISNAVIELAPTNAQGVIQGTVTDTHGHNLSGVRVLATVSVTPAQGSTETSDLLAVTDHNGVYRFPNVPTATVPYTLTATAVGFVNASTTVTSLSNGQTLTRNFQIADSIDASVPTPTNVLVASLTQPSSVLSPNALTANAATSGATSIYDTIRKAMSPKYAQLSANGHVASHSTKLKPHLGGFGSYAVEADVFFSESNIVSVSGYRIYQSVDPAVPQPYDFLQDPQASLYIDLDPGYNANTQYDFQVSAINTDNRESGLSAVSFFDPLDLEVVTSPVQGQTFHGSVGVSWQAIQGATHYGVFIYNKYPSINATPVVQATSLTTTNYNAGTLAPGNYWAVVSAADANSIDVSVSQIIQFQVN